VRDWQKYRSCDSFSGVTVSFASSPDGSANLVSPQALIPDHSR
jgi:hypothetical protein